MIVIDNHNNIKPMDFGYCTVLDGDTMRWRKMRIFVRLDGLLVIYHINKGCKGESYPSLVEYRDFLKWKEDSSITSINNWEL